MRNGSTSAKLPALDTAKIVVYGKIYPAAVCQQCGMRIYPPKELVGHYDRHSTDAKVYVKDVYGNKRPARQWEGSW
jgi:hypothetical protein